MTSTTSAQIKKVKVAGATLHSELRGQGPLLVLIPGGAMDADSFAKLASLLAPTYSVLTYDPRGLSRSNFDDIPVTQNMDTHGSDLAALVQAWALDPALVFGTSGGAQIGLNFAARYPSLLRRLVAHEPPCISLLSDGAKTIERMRGVEKIFHAKGPELAMAAFLQIAGMTPPPKPETPRALPPRVAANIDYFLEFGVRAIGEYRPDIAKLKNRDVVVGAGRDSQGQLAHRTAQALAEQLGSPLIEFPSDHSSWVKTPDEFSKTLVKALKNAN
jgi:pimeloyl-ACP methyl ester carboxylesterase